MMKIITENIIGEANDLFNFLPLPSLHSYYKEFFVFTFLAQNQFAVYERERTKARETTLPKKKEQQH